MSSIVFGNGNDLVHWKSSPSTRGTFDILTTCIITILLCIWSAVHLNVPPPGSVWRPKLRKVGWLILALLAPEMIAYTAWYQRRLALRVMHTVNEAYHLPDPAAWHKVTLEYIKITVQRFERIFGKQKQEPLRQPTLEFQNHSSKNRHAWTLMHGFYAVMGGIAFEIPGKYLRSHTGEIWFINDMWLSFLSEEDSGRKVIPNLSKEEIKARSKANALAKAFVCIQALWFIAQCLTRLVHHIPISLLELNTFGHAVCALLIYLLWWEKPFEVDYPTMVESQLLWSIGALHWMLNNQSPAAESFFRDLRDSLAGDGWYRTLSARERRSLLDSWNEFSLLEDLTGFEERKVDYQSVSTQEIEHSGDHEAGSTILMPGQTLQGTGFRMVDLRSLARKAGILKSFDDYDGSHSPFPVLCLTTEDVNRFKIAWRAVRYLKESKHGWNTSTKWTTLLVSPIQRCEDWPDLRDIRKLPITLGFTAAALMYGGLHALAWHAHFDSSAQQLLWRISACVVMGGFPAFSIIWASPDLFNQKHLLLPQVISTGVLLVAYVLARAYLVVECFINLSHLPAGVYDVPRWAAYFPHIS